ncbi:MAG TPA: energy transducer TonB [Pyrinomonadaceae bacterium]|nr:energy transducer TonB [Pyrinomonadaceae bacterium]
MRLLIAFSLAFVALLQVSARASRDEPNPQQPQNQTPAPTTAAGEINAINVKVRELYDAKKYDEAARLAVTAVESAERLFGAESKEVSAQLSSLANIYLTKRDTGKAKKALARMLESREKRLGPSEKFEQDALEQYTCVIATDLRGKPDPNVAERISRVFIEDSVLAQGFSLSPDKKELQAGSWSSKPPPTFPPEAKMTRSSGAAVMFISIDEAGKVSDVMPLGCSSRAFVAAGADAARRATFKPTLVNGKPVKVRGVIFYRWIIQ